MPPACVTEASLAQTSSTSLHKAGWPIGTSPAKDGTDL